MLMLKLSILMSREVGRDVSTPVTVRRESKPLFAARLAALAEWFRLIALTDLARLALLALFSIFAAALAAPGGGFGFTGVGCGGVGMVTS